MQKPREELGVGLDLGDVEEIVSQEADPVVHTADIVVPAYLTGEERITLDQAHSEDRCKEFAEPSLHPCIYNPLVKTGFSKK